MVSWALQGADSETELEIQEVWDGEALTKRRKEGGPGREPLRPCADLTRSRPA